MSVNLVFVLKWVKTAECLLYKFHISVYTTQTH